MIAPIRERERSAILSSLGAGVVPSTGLHHIQVGRKAELEALLDDLQRTQQGGAAVRFIVGRFGSGKSFFLNLVRTVAMERRFVVATADITTDHRFTGSSGVARGLYSELTRTIATRSKPDGGALSNIVERWISDLSHEAQEQDGKHADVEARIKETLRPIEDLVSGYDLTSVIGSYYRGHVEHNADLQASAIRWLRGEYATRTEARSDLGVRTIIDDESIYDYLKLLAAFVRLAGYGGLLVCFDELVVLSHRLNNRTSRDRNYEAILRIVNDCLQGSVEGLMVLFAATDDCLSDPRRGLFSYEALRTRLADNRFAKEGLVDLSGPVIRLGSLSPEDCYVLLANIRRVFMRGDAEDALLPNEGIERYLASCHERMGARYFQTPRETIKDFVGLLNVLQQNPGADWSALIGALNTVASTEDPGPASADDDDEDSASSLPASTSTGGDDLVSFRLPKRIDEPPAS